MPGTPSISPVLRHSRSRRSVLRRLAGLATGGVSALEAAIPTAAPLSRVSIGQAVHAANSRLVGTNVQWVDGGDDLLQPDGLAFSPVMLARVKALAPTVFRYPGGCMGDTYHWREGIGGLAQRGQCEHFFSRQKQSVRMGIAELFELCRQTDAEALLTLNLASGSAEEAAAWVQAVHGGPNSAPAPVWSPPKACWWELGNEPYLKPDERKELWLTPVQYAERVNRFVQAIRRVAPAARLGLPLRSDRLGGVPATPMPGFNETVLRSCRDVDYVCLHNAYLPFDYQAKATPDDLYRAAMAATATLTDDLAATRAQVERLCGKRLPIAITEYNALFTLTMDQSSSDRLIGSMLAALYTADVLRCLAYQPDVLMGNFWSLSGNWHFGAIRPSGQVHPSYHVLAAFRRVLQGDMLACKVDAPHFDAPQVGYAAARRLQPAVEAVATRQTSSLHVLLINKQRAQELPCELQLPGDASHYVINQAHTLHATDPVDSANTGHTGLSPRPLLPVPTTPGWRLVLPPASVSWLRLDKPSSAAQRKHLSASHPPAFC